MEYLNQQVVHKRFGSGKIKSYDGKMVEVYFQEYGARSFLYPSAFEKFLTPDDEEFGKTVAEDLNKLHQEETARALEQMRLQAEAEKAAKAVKTTKTTKTTSSRGATRRRAAGSPR